MTVTVFTNPSNPQCEATEQELAKLGVRYDTVDLTKNPSTCLLYTSPSPRDA